MTLTARTIFLLMLVLTLAGELIAQEAPTTATSPAATAATAEDAPETGTPETGTDETGTNETGTPETAAETPTEETENPSTGRHYQVREQFTRLLEQHPYELWMILKLDPALLTNDAFMSGYPEVRELVARHPEILKNPRFYLARFDSPAQDGSVLEAIFTGLAVFGGVGLTVVALGWLIRTLIEQKRWKQLSRTQSDVHNKILDRFNTTEQLLEYIRTPAGTKFLESAPIPLHVERPPSRKTSTLAARILWSVQIGVVTAIVGLGMLLLSAVFDKDSSHGLFALGAIALCVGTGFIASAIVSLKLSRRLGLWEDGGAPPEAIDGTGPVR
ncbi:MAG TPA: hypothetical protein VLQ45_24460 [Thermoanaerobaculia bacterium]|nr:hypothetical protein [Thermoanaerobaculia bacterium]